MQLPAREYIIEYSRRESLKIYIFFVSFFIVMELFDAMQWDWVTASLNKLNAGCK